MIWQSYLHSFPSPCSSKPLSVTRRSTMKKQLKIQPLNIAVSHKLLVSYLFFFLASILPLMAGEPNRIELWPDGAPGSQDRKHEPENTDRTNGACNVTNIHAPSITKYLPEPQKATGTAIIIAPGGGHRMLCLGHEGDSLLECRTWFRLPGQRNPCCSPMAYATQRVAGRLEVSGLATKKSASQFELGESII